MATFQYQQTPNNLTNDVQHQNRKRQLNHENAGTDAKKTKIQNPPITGPQIFKLYQSRDYKECLRMIDEILKFSDTRQEDPMTTQYKIIQAACWTMLDINNENIKNQLMEIISKDPKNSFAHYGYGLYKYHEGNMMKSIESFALAIDLNPTGAMKKALELKAKAKSFNDMLCEVKRQYEASHFAKAVDILTAALLVDPENKTMTTNIINQRNSYVKELVLKLEAEIDNELPDKFKDAEKLMKTNQLVKAEKLVNEVNVEEPESERAHYIRGLYLYLTGSIKEAHNLFKKALEVNGKMEKAVKMEEKSRKLNELFDGATLDMANKNYSEAIEKFTQVIEFDKENNFICQASYFQRALASFNIGEFDAAFEDYKHFESMKKIVGNVLKEIEVPDVVRGEQTKEESEPKPKKSKIQKKKDKESEENEEKIENGGIEDKNGGIDDKNGGIGEKNDESLKNSAKNTSELEELAEKPVENVIQGIGNLIETIAKEEKFVKKEKSEEVIIKEEKEKKPEI